MDDTTAAAAPRRSTGRRRDIHPATQLPVLALDRDQAAAACGIGMSTFKAAVQQGLLPKPRQIKGCARWPVAELQAALMSLPVSDLLPPPAPRRGAA